MYCYTNICCSCHCSYRFTNEGEVEAAANKKIAPLFREQSVSICLETLFAPGNIHWELVIASIHRHFCEALRVQLSNIILFLGILYISKLSVGLHQIPLSTTLSFPCVARLCFCLFYILPLLWEVIQRSWRFEDTKVRKG